MFALAHARRSCGTGHTSRVIGVSRAPCPIVRWVRENSVEDAESLLLDTPSGLHRMVQSLGLDAHQPTRT